MTKQRSDLFLRYERACDFSREVNEARVTECLTQFFRGLGVSVTVRKIGSFVSARSAGDAWDALVSRADGDAGVAWDVWDSLDTRSAWVSRDPRVAWDAWASSAAGVAWDPRVAWADGVAWDVSWNATHLLGATQNNNQEQIRIWTPYFEAFEAGCWAMFHFGTEVLWLPLPKLTKNAHNQCHADGRPAFCLPEESLYFLNGIPMEEWMVMTHAESIPPTKILEVINADQRRELLRKVGIERFIASVGAKEVDRYGDYTLLSIDFNGGPRTYLKMLNPSIGVWHVEGVSNECRTVAEALRWRQPDAMRALPIATDGARWYQQGDVVIWPSDATALQAEPSVLT